MRFPRTRSSALAGVVAVLAACAGGDSAPVADAAPAPECYLARGTKEDAEARPSPLAEVALSFERGAARLCYGAPSANDRAVMDSLVPFGQLWRTGANEATALHTSVPLTIGSVSVGPGRYSIYTRPGEASWEVYVNGVFDRWGIPITSEIREADLGSFAVTPEDTGGMVERLTFRWEPDSPTGGHLILEWEETRVRIPVTSGS